MLSAGALALAVLWVWMRLRLYARVFSPESLADFARVLARLRAAALQRVEGATGPQPPRADEPRQGLTSSGILVYYTIDREGGAYAHHLSLSLGGRYTAGPVGRTLAALAAVLLGVPAEYLAVARSENTVFHVRFAMTAEGQAAFAAAAVEIPSPARARQLHSECAELGRRLRVQDINVAAMAREQQRGD